MKDFILSNKKKDDMIRRFEKALQEIYQILTEDLKELQPGEPRTTKSIESGLEMLITYLSNNQNYINTFNKIILYTDGLCIDDFAKIDEITLNQSLFYSCDIIILG